MMTRAELLAELRSQVEETGTQTAWAEAHGIHQSQVSAVLRGVKPMSDRFAEKMGYRVLFKRKVVPLRRR